MTCWAGPWFSRLTFICFQLPPTIDDTLNTGKHHYQLLPAAKPLMAPRWGPRPARTGLHCPLIPSSQSVTCSFQFHCDRPVMLPDGHSHAHTVPPRWEHLSHFFVTSQGATSSRKSSLTVWDLPTSSQAQPHEVTLNRLALILFAKLLSHVCPQFRVHISPPALCTQTQRK